MIAVVNCLYCFALSENIRAVNRSDYFDYVLLCLTTSTPSGYILLFVIDQWNFL